MREPNPLPLVRQHINERQHRRRVIAVIANEPLPGRGKTDMALRTAQRHAEMGETEP